MADSATLSIYLPMEAVIPIQKWVQSFAVRIVFKNPRSGKLGDYRFERYKNLHLITINNNLGKDLSLLTLTHEIAHLHTFAQYKRATPHGREWKNIFSGLIEESLSLYSEETQQILHTFKKNPKANFYSDTKLALHFHHQLHKDALLLADIPENDCFMISKRIFRKGKIKNKRYFCTELRTGRTYLIQSIAPVNKIV